MLFQINRASAGDPRVKPCAETTPGQWTSSTGHVQDVWYIEINTLEELLQLVEKEGDVIVGKDSVSDFITIYDEHPYAY